MFNTRRLKLPPTCCMKNTVNKYSSEQIGVCRGVLYECTSILSNKTPWSTEQFVLSRLIYKLNCQFRTNKSLHMLKRVQICVSRYCEMKILSQVKEFKDLFNSFTVGSVEVFLPSRQMLESLLVQMMGAAALLTQTSRYCLHAYEYLKWNLEIGYLIPQNLLFLSIICRIWALSRSTCLHYISWYNQLYDMLDHLEATKASWLTDDNILPPDLSKWLKQENNDFEKLNMNSSVPDVEEKQSSSTSTSLDREKFLKNREDEGEMEDSEDIGCPVLRTEESNATLAFHVTSNTNSKPDTELNMSKKDKTDRVTFVHLYSDRISVCSSLKQLKKLVKSITKENLNDKQKLKVQKCSAKLKKFKMKETECKKSGKNTRKYINMGRKCVNLLLKLLDKNSVKLPRMDMDTRTEMVETNDRNVANFENESSLLDYVRTASKGKIRQMIKELKEKNYLSHNSKSYGPLEKRVANKLSIKLKKVSKLKDSNEKEIVLRKIETLLKNVVTE